MKDPKLSRVRVAALAAALWLSLAGCTPTGAQLDGTRWRLASWALSSLAPSDFAITTEFHDGHIGVRCGANTFDGPYKLGSGDAFRAGPFIGTLSGPEPAMRTVGVLMDLLTQVRSCRIGEGRLTLNDEGGEALLIFEAVGE